MSSKSQNDDSFDSPRKADTCNAFTFLMSQSNNNIGKKNENGSSNNAATNRKKPLNNRSTASVASEKKSSDASQPSRFASCPYCSKSISSAFIQVHVETCNSNAEYQQQEYVRRERKKAKIFHKHRASMPNTVVTPDKNAFTKMMDQSKNWNNFGENKSINAENTNIDNPNRKAKRQQWFHLTKDMKVIWIADRSGGNIDGDNSNCQEKVDKLCGEIHWSSSILIHASKVNETNQDNIELNITSSIPSASSAQTPFVLHHSRLSIPVLKSILQKSVRRRRPLPSVKVAMEMADKGLGELLRRLPIICIEDSTLHHDFPFLVWLMVAQSKQFQPTRPMMTRLFRAVFEIASCPWQDNLDIPKASDDDPKHISLTAVTEIVIGEDMEENKVFQTECDLLLRSILLRHKYGGMGCDMRMLQRCAMSWKYRFTKEKLMNSQLAQACLPKYCSENSSGGTTLSISWSQVPKLLHPMERSSKAVLPLLVRPLPYLKYSDATPAGVDFHCSNVLDMPLYNINMQSQIQELYHGSSETPIKLLSVQEISAILKKACWEHCSGTNYRRTFRQALTPKSANQADTIQDKEKERIKRVWDFVSPNVQKFSQEYLAQRLVTPR
ncbi:unnamed protein product [Cylindrotheca closterium]|uniref:UBZ4-type domain-containing protein n=1 Tax=Cylindrotheca closterium TaxID=2856 RepID=A0AAD2JLL8_9STRA|nr:unnamed protein product [Cylindrotheca closterium]